MSKRFLGHFKVFFWCLRNNNGVQPPACPLHHPCRGGGGGLRTSFKRSLVPTKVLWPECVMPQFFPEVMKKIREASPGLEEAQHIRGSVYPPPSPPQACSSVFANFGLPKIERRPQLVILGPRFQGFWLILCMTFRNSDHANLPPSQGWPPGLPSILVQGVVSRFVSVLFALLRPFRITLPPRLTVAVAPFAVCEGAEGG